MNTHAKKSSCTPAEEEQEEEEQEEEQAFHRDSLLQWESLALAG